MINFQHIHDLLHLLGLPLSRDEKSVRRIDNNKARHTDHSYDLSTDFGEHHIVPALLGDEIGVLFSHQFEVFIERIKTAKIAPIHVERYQLNVR